MNHHRSTTNPRPVFAGIDTHADSHHVAVIDHDGHPLAEASFPTTTAGYQQLIAFLTSHGTPTRIGIEGTSSYGAAITHLLAAADHTVVEVNRPDRRLRRNHGKSDPLDAHAAAQAVRTGRSSTAPKLNSGAIEQLRLTMIVRDSAIKSRTQAVNEARSILRSGPAALADQHAGLPTTQLITALARLRPTKTADPTLAATKKILTRLARRCQHLSAEIAEADTEITDTVTRIAPELLAKSCVGPHSAARLLITAGSNPDRLTSEAAFARLTGVAPIPASSGKTNRHRLHRGGDRQANHALWRIAFNRRQHHDQTRAYREKRLAHNRTDNEILRCLKRALVRELFPHLRLAITRLAATS